jgi:hypothetical protein
MCDEKVVAGHVDDRPQGSFINYVLVAKEIDANLIGNITPHR